MKIVGYLSLLLASFECFSQSGDFHSINTSVVMQAGNYNIIAAGGDIVEDFSGRLAYLGVASKSSSGATWKLGYFGYYPNTGQGHYQYDNRLRGSLTYPYSLGKWNFFHRSRWEYRMGSFAKGNRYRPAVGLAYSISFGEIKIDTFSELETFFELRKEKITLTLFTLGIKTQLTSGVSIALSQFNVFDHESREHFKGPRVDINFRL